MLLAQRPFALLVPIICLEAFQAQALIDSQLLRSSPRQMIWPKRSPCPPPDPPAWLKRRRLTSALDEADDHSLKEALMRASASLRTSKTEVEKIIKVLREQQEDVTHAKEVITNMIKATSASEQS